MHVWGAVEVHKGHEGLGEPEQTTITGLAGLHRNNKLFICTNTISYLIAKPHKDFFAITFLVFWFNVTDQVLQVRHLFFFESGQTKQNIVYATFVTYIHAFTKNDFWVPLTKGLHYGSHESHYLFSPKIPNEDLFYTRAVQLLVLSNEREMLGIFPTWEL